MTFQWPIALALLILVPLLAGLYVWMQTRRRKYALQYASVSLVQQAVGNGPGVRRHVPAVLYLLALTAMVFALARPTATIPVAQNTGTVILSIDVSGSMQAEDVDPNRMEATKQAVREFVENQPRGVKIGIVTFSDFAALVAPPTRERKPVLDAINRMRPQRGTNIGSGLQVALDAIYEDGGDFAPGAAPTPTPPRDGSRPPAATIVLLSDGQSNTGPPPLRVAEEAQTAGIKVYTIGIGTPEGTILQIQGRNVFTRLDEETLQGVAELTDARYFAAADEGELRQIYDDLARERLIEDEETEITFLLTGLAMLISIAAGGLGLLWFNRLP
ncbi:MAG: VWA domain-containing protein [Dehalococcoidia bacterium]|nr:VWA domain-containing protein [Dehalococcoidia bacterium]